MNKAELIEALAVHFDGNKAEAARALSAVTDTIIANVAKGEKVSITGFGAFEAQARPARMVRNPRTGEYKKAKATKVPRFRAGSELKAYVSGEKKVAKAPAKKSAAKKTATTRAAAATTSNSPAKTAATKTAAKKAPATKTAAKKTAAKKTAR